jgi:hypothetical protein
VVIVSVFLSLLERVYVCFFFCKQFLPDSPMLVKSVDDFSFGDRFSALAGPRLERRISRLRVRLGFISVDSRSLVDSLSASSEQEDPAASSSAAQIQAKIKMLRQPYYDLPPAAQRRQQELDELCTLEKIEREMKTRRLFLLFMPLGRLSSTQLIFLGAGLVALVAIAYGGVHKIKEFSSASLKLFSNGQ